MKQQSLEISGFEKYRKKTRKEMFLDEMNEIIAWGEMTEAIAPYYPKEAKGAGSKPIGLERMLQIHFLQHWFELSEPAAEEILYDSRAMRQFAGINLCHEAAPDETTICKFRHLMEKYNLGDELFCLDVYLSENALKVSRGTHRRCVDHQRAQLYQEQRQATRPGYASEPQRQSMVFWYENARWCG